MPGARLTDERLAAAVVLGFLAVRLLAASFTDLVPDEAYYWLWSRHPAASYYDHPPMVAWWMWLGTALFGNSTLAVRLLSMLTVLPASAALYATGRRLFTAPIAAVAVVFLNASILLGTGGFLATPDAPSMLFWTLGIYAFVAALQSGRPVWWLALGIFAGLGFLSKLTNLFFGLGIGLALVSDRNARSWLLTPWPWLAALAAAAVTTPMIVWNAGHDWVTFTKQMGRIGSGGWAPWHLPEFIAVQALLLNPAVAVLLGLAVIGWWRDAPAGERRGIAMLLATAAPLLAYFAFHALHGRIEGNWPAPVYPTLALIAAAGASRIGDSRHWPRRIQASVAPVGAVTAMIGLLVFALPGLLPPKIDFARLVRGWAELADAAGSLRSAAGAAWIGTTQYGVTGELAYHLRDRDVPVVQVTDRVRYDYEGGDAAAIAGPGILVTDGGVEALRSCFADIAPVGTATRGAYGTFGLFRVDGARPGILAGKC